MLKEIGIIGGSWDGGGLAVDIMLGMSSADAGQSGVAMAVGASAAAEPEPAIAPEPVAVPPPAAAAVVPVASENVGGNGKMDAAAAAPAAAAVTRRGYPRLAAQGYALLAVATAVAILLPRMRMRAGFVEDALVILSILGMIAGAGMVMVSFVWNLVRQV